MTITPFRPDVPDSALQDLRTRMEHVRWPEAETDAGQGPSLATMQSLVQHWHTAYDWRRAEVVLDGFGQYRTEIDGLGIHFLHTRSPEPDALPLPLLLCHGWPGSVLEFRDVIGPLTDPVAHGGSAADAFHVVVPSMPGFGFSDKPTEPGWDIARIARAWTELMTRLDYSERWVAQGGDWGSAVVDTLGRQAPAGLTGIHLNMVPVFPTADEVANATPDEQAMIASAQHYQQALSAYAFQQTTRPQTVGYLLADNPVGLAAWIYGLFQDVSDSGGHPEKVLGMDYILDDIMLYWLPNTGASSARIYWEAARSAAPPAGRNPTPVGVSVFPHEPVRASRRWLDARYDDVVHYCQLPAGGHFAALEQPAALVEEIRTTFRGLR